MKRKIFVVAAMFLALAMIVPPFMIHLHSDADLINILNQGAQDATQVEETIRAINDANLRLLAIVGVIEIVSVILFAVLLWIAMKP